MSLLDSAMEPFVMLDKSTQSDGYGGYISVWTEGAPFRAAVTFNSSVEAKIAAAQGVKSLYTVTTSRAMTLEYHDVIKRMSDGKILRVTSDGDDSKTPGVASLDMRQVSAEEWRLPDG